MGNALEILEFDKIKQMLSKYSFNELCNVKINNLHPLYFYEEASELLNKTKEGYLLATLANYPSLNTLRDKKIDLLKVGKDGILSIEEIFEFYYQLDVVYAYKNYLKDKNIENGEFFYFKRYVNSLTYISEVHDRIKNSIDYNYQIYDNATSKLKSIRNSIKNLEVQIKEKLNHYLKNNASDLTDLYIASRGNHLVLPVKASSKNNIKGVVIDISASSNTYFIEPLSVIESNVELEKLRYDEQLEIARIIKALCEIINKYNVELSNNNEILAEISFMILKGNFGLSKGYELATPVDDNIIEIIDGYHPFIEESKVVKNDFKLGNENNNIIIISGPNAGGKTVALKTVGLLCLMNQSGLPIPVKEAKLGIFQNIFVDIGDKQSIEESLSGFSSHISSVSDIINNLNRHSLVILDELGSKTDPVEGQALAKAIIEYIEKANCLALITTHYNSIKDLNSSSITLAAMGFYKETLKPTYKLLLNTIGRSYALEISTRLGLKKEIIEKARTYKDSKNNELDQIIDNLSSKLALQDEIINNIKAKELEIEEKLSAISIEKEKYEKLNERLQTNIQKEKDKLLEEAYDKISEIVENFKKESASEYKPHLKNKAIAELDKLNQEENEDDTFDAKILVGDDVLITSLNKHGKVLSISGMNATVVTNNNTIHINLSKLEKVKPVKEIKKVKTYHDKALHASMSLSLNIVGYRVEEGLIALREYLDKAIVANLEQVSIIHGHGTGALRKAVQDYLKTLKFVKSFRLGEYNEGGVGVTIVTLK